MKETVSDRAIDTVARRMTTREPSVGFSARVVARLDEGRVRRLPWTWIAVPVGAAALVILAIALLSVMRGPQHPTAQPGPVVKGSEPAPPSVPPAPVPLAPEDSTVAQARPKPAAVGRDSGIVIEPAHARVVVEVLERHAPISVAPVQPATIQLPDVSVTPLADLKPIEVEPLPASGGRE